MFLVNSHSLLEKFLSDNLIFLPFFYSWHESLVPSSLDNRQYNNLKDLLLFSRVKILSHCLLIEFLPILKDHRFFLIDSSAINEALEKLFLESLIYLLLVAIVRLRCLLDF